MGDTEQTDRLEREDTNVSEAPSTASVRAKTRSRGKKGGGMSPTSSRARSPESRPRSSQSSEFVTEGKRKKKQASVPPGAHKVSFTITIAKAIPVSSDNDEAATGAETARRKKRIVEAPRAQNYYHCEYFLLPDDDDPVKTDVVTFGMAAKIYTERQEPKVLKTWNSGDQSWVAWTHCHPVIITDEVLMKLFNHTLELRIWDTRDKLSTRAKFDRPKAFRLPQAKPGEDAENVGGVKLMVMKQSRNFESLQPKRPYINRPLPSQARSPVDSKESSVEDERSRLEKPPSRKSNRRPGEKDGAREGTKSAAPPAGPAPINPPTQDGQPLKSYGHLLGLAGKDPLEESGESSVAAPRPSAGRGRAAPSGRPQKHDTLPALQPRADLHVPPRTGDSESTLGPGKSNSKYRRNKKAEAAAQAAAEHARKYGVATVSIRMATLFAGMQTVTNRLDKPVPTLEDVFVTVSLNGPLMSEEQRQKLNPLIIKVHAATDMPSTPIPYADLRLRCMPAYVKYKFFDQAEYKSFGREQDDAIYWDDINVVLAGTLDRSELCEYLNGPPLTVEVHDRDRVLEKQKLKPTLFGDDLEDQKINNVGTVTSKRTLHDPFTARDRPWDPYGVARFDLSGLLLGQKVLHLEAPIHTCPAPDLLGTGGGGRDGSAGGGGRLVGVEGATDGPTDPPLAAGHYLQSNAVLKLRVEIAHLLTTPASIAAKEDLPTTSKCPFNRIIFRFDYHNVRLLHQLQGHIMDTNARALQLDSMPQHVTEAALSTYKLSVEQQQSRTLDIVTGFQVMDGTRHLFVLEGLRDGAVADLWRSIPKESNTGNPFAEQRRAQREFLRAQRRAARNARRREAAARRQQELRDQAAARAQEEEEEEEVEATYEGQEVEVDQEQPEHHEASAEEVIVAPAEEVPQEADDTPQEPGGGQEEDYEALREEEGDAPQVPPDQVPTIARVHVRMANMDVLFNSDLSFRERLYGPLDVDLCRVKLHEPLNVIMQQPLLYVRDMVPQPCFQALTRLHQVLQVRKMREVVRNDLFPSAEMVISMSREFGVPLTTEDFEDLQPEEEPVSTSPVQFVDAPRTSRQWTPIDNVNQEWLDQVQDREASKHRHDYIKENKDAVHECSVKNQVERAKTSPTTVRADVTVAHNYSTQTLNATEQAKEKVRKLLEKEPDYRFTYCPDYHHSMTVVPVNVEAEAKAARDKSVGSWKTPSGWVFPGKKTMRESNVHPQKPHPARIDDVHQEWVENTLHANVLNPTLDREGLPWSERDRDFNVWRRPPGIFGTDEPATIHLAGAKLAEERLVARRAEQQRWRDKVIVADDRMTFHRCAPDTEARDGGREASNQLDRLRSVLKDSPAKLSLRRPPMALTDVPPLGVVVNPSVDTAARLAGRRLEPAVDGEGDERGPGFAPGPYIDHSWTLERNKVPVLDYEHRKFMELKGHDFNVYHKPRSSLHKRTIEPLTDKEYQSQLFRWPTHVPTPQPFVIPTAADVKATVRGAMAGSAGSTTVNRKMQGLLPPPTSKQELAETC